MLCVLCHREQERTCQHGNDGRVVGEYRIEVAYHPHSKGGDRSRSLYGQNTVVGERPSEEGR